MATDLNEVLMAGTPDAAPAPEPDQSESPQHSDHVDQDSRWDGGEGPDHDTGDKRPAPGPEVPPASDDEDTDRPVPVKALQEERRKRQEAERRLAAYEQRENPDPTADPVRARLDLSVEYAKEQFEDYETAETAFVEAVKQHPRGRDIYQQMLKDAHPARYAYNVGKQLLALDEIGDPRTYRQRVLAETKSREPKASPSLPPTLASSRDSGGRFSPRDTKTATPLGDILAR